MDRKEQIIEAATHLFQSRGFTGFSYQDLSDLLGIRKASIHHHFRTKDALAEALGEHYYAMMRDDLGRVDRDNPSPRAKLAGLLELYENKFRDKAHMCPLGSITSGWGHLPGSLQNRFHSMFRMGHDWLTGVLAQGRARQEMDFEGDPSDLALTLMATLKGGAQLAVAEGPEVFDVIVRQVSLLVGTTTDTTH